MRFREWFNENSGISSWTQKGNGLLIGVFHNDQIRLPDQVKETAKRLALFGVWHEGKNVEPVVSQFIKETFPGVVPKSWDIQLSKTEGLVADLFGGDTHVFLNQTGLSPQETLIQCLLRSQKNWSDGAQLVSENDIRSVFKMGGFEQYLDQKMTEQQFSVFHEMAQNAVFPQNGNSPNPLCRVAKALNIKRDKHLLQLMNNPGGIFFAGNDHIQLVNQLR